MIEYGVSLQALGVYGINIGANVPFCASLQFF